MIIEDKYIKLIFGLKLKQIRTERDLSLFGLSKLTGLSKSYLNEIEKGKKYPKMDKIALLSDSLEVPYDHLVSLKLDKNLAPVGEILQSNMFKEIPLDLFGIKENTLIDIIANAPAKVNAFINTIIKIAKNYNLTRESFFLAALRSYQEAHNNYFEDIEEHVKSFAKSYQIDLSQMVKAQDLEEILVEEFDYNINTEELAKYNNLRALRSVFIPKKRMLLLSQEISEAQKTFIYAKEIAYNFLKIEDRLYTFPWIKFDSFDQVLNNFIASYFAGALIISQESLVSQLKELFDAPTWSPIRLHKIIKSYNCSDETFYQRLTNLLPHVFNIKNLFFLRFTYKKGTPVYRLSKELHITQQQSPHANKNQDHYCRRWISLQTIQDFLNSDQKKSAYGIQISSYKASGNDYLVISSANKDPFKQDIYRSVSIGMLLSSHLKKKLKFLENNQFQRREVGVTCESCGIMDCQERVAEPWKLAKQERYDEVEQTVEQLIASFE